MFVFIERFVIPPIIAPTNVCGHTSVKMHKQREVQRRTKRKLRKISRAIWHFSPHSSHVHASVRTAVGWGSFLGGTTVDGVAKVRNSRSLKLGEGLSNGTGLPRNTVSCERTSARSGTKSENLEYSPRKTFNHRKQE